MFLLHSSLSPSDWLLFELGGFRRGAERGLQIDCRKNRGPIDGAGGCVSGPAHEEWLPQLLGVRFLGLVTGNG